MPRYPGAVWRPIREERERTEPRIRATQFIFHSAVPGGSSLYNFFENVTSIESHFYVNYRGVVEQYMDTDRCADANVTANHRRDGTGALSVETQDNRDPDNDPWTKAQVRELIDLGRWAARVEGIPRRICRTHTDPGFGWHVMFGAPGPWTGVRGKTCPGRIRIQQLKKVIFPAIFETKTWDGILRRGSRLNPEDKVREVQRGLVRLGFDIGDFGPKGDGVDGDYGGATAKGVSEFKQHNPLTTSGGGDAWGDQAWATLKRRLADLDKPPPPTDDRKHYDVTVIADRTDNDFDHGVAVALGKALNLKVLARTDSKPIEDVTMHGAILVGRAAGMEDLIAGLTKHHTRGKGLKVSKVAGKNRVETGRLGGSIAETGRGHKLVNRLPY